MYCIVEQGGFQYQVAEGDTIRVPLIDADQGAEVTIEKVLLVAGEQPKVGTPIVEGAQVKAKVLEHAKYDKIIVIKKKRRKGYRRRNGHRQDYTKLQILSITA